MSITGSLVGYENNNEISSNNKKKRRSILSTNALNTSGNTSMGKNCSPSLNSSISNSVITTASSSHSQQQAPPPQHHQHHHQQQQQQQQLQQKYMNSKRKHAKYNNMLHPAHMDHNNYLHLNSLWSIWYGVLLTLFQGYLAVHGAYRFLGCSLIPWKIEPVAELNLQIVLSGVVFILLPLFFTSAVFKVGNLANDGIKLATGSKERRCSMSPHDGLEEEARGGTLRALWTHGGPTAAFVHIVIALCLLLPRLLLEARIIENGLLPRENIWQTELDFIAVNRRNLVVLSVVTSPYQNHSTTNASEDEDYYNDTMFTAVGSGGNTNNNLLDDTGAITRKETGVAKTRFFEVPDLINRESYEGEDEDGARHANSAEHSNGGRISVEELDSKELVETKSLQPQQPATASSGPTMTTTKAANNRVADKSYDKTWDRLATLDKDNRLDNEGGVGGYREEQTTTVGEVTSTTAAATDTTPRTTRSTTSTTTTTTSTTTTTTTTTTTPSTTTSTTSTSTVAIPTIVATSQTSNSSKAHTHHQHHQHQHHNGKSGRKHHANRQHRQRSHRRHHATTTSTTTTERSAEVLNSFAVADTQAVDFNSLDDLEMSTVFERAPARPHNRVPSDDSFEDMFDYGRRTLNPKTTSTISTTTRDSNIHIVKPEKLPEIIPSTPLTSNSKIIEIKAKMKRMKRMADEELQVEIEPEYLISDVSNNDSSSASAEFLATSSAAASETSSQVVVNPANQASNAGGLVRLDGFSGMLQIFFGIEKAIDVAVFDHPPSAEFVNLVFALLVWCVRYPAVFWSTTKAFATIFSIQMIAAALDIVFSYVGVANLYKLQVYSEAMPIQNPGLILNGVVTLALFLLSSALMIASSMIMYLYGHGRLAAKMRDRSLITMKSSETWIYFAHCASLCYVLALAVVKAPLLNDLSATYKNNLHCPTFLSALISVVHLLLWIVIWLGLTAKRRWTFKLPPVDAYGITKATTQPLLMAQRGSNSTGGGSLTGVVSGGSIDQKGVISTGSSTDGGGGTDDIYWPKLTPSSPKLKVTFNEVTSTSDDVLLIGDHEQTDGKRDSPRGTTVCFTSATGEIDDGEYATLRAATAATVVGFSSGSIGGGGGSISGATGHGSSILTPTGSISIVSSVKILHLSEYDELPPPPPPQLMPQSVAHAMGTGGCNISDYANCGGLIDDNTSEEGKLLACVRDDSVTYASTRDLEPPTASTSTGTPPPPPPPPLSMCSSAAAERDSSSSILRAATAAVAGGRAPQAMPEIMQLSSSPEHLVSPLAPVTVTVHTNEAHIASSSTPRCLRRADSGVPNEALTPRSDTTSTTESTTSPPERAPSESSSGVHSGEERDVEVVIRPRVACKPPPKPPQPAIQEEPYGRCTNMRMSSFNADPTRGSSSATLPLTRSAPDQKFDYATHCSTMPLPAGCHSQQHAVNGNNGYSSSSAQSMYTQQQQQQQQHISSFKTQMYANSAVAMAGANAAKMLQHQQQHLHQQQLQQLQQQQQQQQQQSSMHTTLPNGVRYSNPHFLRRLPHVTKAAESPYGHLGLGAGHHTFSKLLHDPLQGSLVNTAIPEDRDSANYSMSSDQDCGLYATANHLN